MKCPDCGVPGDEDSVIEHFGKKHLKPPSSKILRRVNVNFRVCFCGEVVMIRDSPHSFFSESSSLWMHLAGCGGLTKHWTEVMLGG